MTRHRVPTLRVCAISAAVLATVVAASVALCGGRLIFTLDDPYIHLAVAENIVRGQYGVNLAEPSAPSSSILFPLVSAALLEVGLGPWAILALNCALSVAAVHVFLRSTAGETADGLATPPGRRRALGLAAVASLCLSPFALPMTGLEHGAQVLLAVLAIRLLAGDERGPGLRIGLPAVMGLAPLVRFEGLGLVAGLCVGLAIRRRFREALLGGAAAVSLVGVHALVMMRLGLPPLPSSVTTKSKLAHAVLSGDPGDAWPALWDQLTASLAYQQARISLLLAALLAVSIAVRSSSRARAVAAAALVVLTLHLLGGRFDWFYRYEVYAIAAAVVALWIANAEALASILSRAPRLAVAGLFLGAAVCGAPYALATLNAPRAARGIYEQQYQMHRFATEYWKRPVAVNDLGWVSYRNDAFVLDVVGLGSEEVRKLRAADRFDAAAVERLMGARGVRLAMIYESWLAPVIPRSWVKVGVLRTKPVTSAEGDVTFYATDEATAGEVRGLLAAFARTLPSGARLKPP